MSQAGGNWRVKRWLSRWMHRGQIIERVVVVSKRQWADRALKAMRVAAPESYVRLDIPGMDLVVFLPCPIEPGVVDFTPEYLAGCRACDAELAAVLEAPAEDVPGDLVEKPERRPRPGRSRD